MNHRYGDPADPIMKISYAIAALVLTALIVPPALAIGIKLAQLILGH